MRCMLAVDIGASGGRHIVGWTENGKIHTKEIYRFSNGASMKNGHLCWDGDMLWENVLAGMAACAQQGFQPVSMGIDTWAVDYMLLDAQDQPVGDLIAYRDTRTQGMDKELESRLPFADYFERTGIARQMFNTIYQQMAVVREHPEYKDQVKDFLFLPSYLSFRLTGKKMHEWTNISASGLTDCRTQNWAWDVVDAAGIPRHWFQTPIAQPGTVLGTLLPEIQQRVGYDTKVILTAAHDTASAYIAVPAADEHAVFLSSGTWSLLGAELDTPCTTEESRLAGFTNEGGSNGTIRYLKNIMGLWMLQCLRKETDNRYTFAEMAEMADKSAYAYYIDAADERFMAPVSMLDEVKTVLRDQGAPEPQTFDDILRAVTVGLAASYRDSIRQMSSITGRTFTSVNIVGGGCQNVTLNQMTADLTGLPVFAGPSEGTALGNLGVQMITDGIFPDKAAVRSAIRESVEIKKYIPRQ